MPPSQRMSAVRKTAACTNCLREGHYSTNCSSKHTCKVCNRKHHSLLHVPNSAQAAGSGSSSSGQVPPPTVSTNTASSAQLSQPTQVLLKTALVHIKNKFGRSQSCRVLLDDGSEASFITEKCAKSLACTQPHQCGITGIAANSAANVKWKTTAHLHSYHQEGAVEVELLILPKVTGMLPRVEVDSTQWSHLSGIKLADPLYGNVDLLLGADVVASIMRDGRKYGPADAPLLKTRFWMGPLGKVSTQPHLTICSNVATCN
ncbi:hypothetical protein Ocin01_19560 [Orchesella cincta]|uniref:Uncharacterized protein n=1 Tax=Orchesella cincta TaxID=48709 RepID=A0A1D2M2F6_ORCCI|nr:hypothetical protein Ocin01_19560 [Orchesella cincta]